MIKEETYAMIWGTVLLVVGLVILLFVLGNILDIAQHPSERLEQWAPEEIKGPTAAFMWWSQNKSVDFNDASVEGSAEITTWNWDFGDGSIRSDQNPSYEYSTIGDYTVTLEVEDENGNTHNTRTRVSLSEDATNEGQTQASMSFDLGLETTFKRMTVSIVFLVAFAILVMIGGRILVAGCRLIRPSVKFYKMKVKQKEIEKNTQDRQKTLIKK